MAGEGQGRPGMDGDGWRWQGMARNGQEWPGMAGNGRLPFDIFGRRSDDISLFMYVWYYFDLAWFDWFVRGWLGMAENCRGWRDMAWDGI